MTTVTTPSIEILNAALAAFREEYRARYIAAFTYRLDQLQKKLAECGGDINKAYPYPSSSQSRKSYVQAKNEYSWAHRVTEEPPLGESPYDVEMEYESGKKFWSRPGSYRPGAPRYVKIKQAAYDDARKQAISAADSSIDGYIRKLSGKIGKDIVSAAYTGRDLWFGSDLLVVCVDGEKQEWHTKCILNVSCLGTVFNQWPTRRRK